MRKAIKTKGKIVQAYRLGDDNHPVIKNLISKGLIKVIGNGRYQLFSQEAVNGEGQEAEEGYYVRIDSTGAPYPNSPDFVKTNLKHISGDDYEHIPQPVYIWTAEDDMCDEVQYLIEHKGLVIDENSFDKYFTAPLWGALLSAKKNAVIVFYEIKKDEEGIMTDADFNFVEYNEFNKTYNLIE